MSFSNTRYNRPPRMPVIKRQESSTKKLSMELQVRFEIKAFQKVVLDQKMVKQSKPIWNDTDSGRLAWILIVGARNGKDGSSANDYCYVKLRLIKTIPSFLKSFPVLYSFGLLNADGGIDFKTETFKTLSTDLIRISGNDVEFFNRSKLKANKNQVIVEDTVTVVCQITIGNTTDDGNETQSKIDYRQTMFRDQVLTDVSIVTSDHEIIRAHKCMLGRSPVFRAMFMNEMKEKQSGEVIVKNFKHCIMLELLNFIYTDKVQDLDSVAGELLIAADFYDLPELKEICIHSLERHVNFNNFAHSLFVAERFQIISIREAVLKFVIENRKTIMSCAGWEELQAYKELSNFVIAAVFDNSF